MECGILSKWIFHTSGTTDIRLKSTYTCEEAAYHLPYIMLLKVGFSCQWQRLMSALSRIIDKNPICVCGDCPKTKRSVLKVEDKKLFIAINKNKVASRNDFKSCTDTKVENYDQSKLVFGRSVWSCSTNYWCY